MSSHDDEALANLLESIGRQAFPKASLEILLQYEGNSEEARAAGIARAQGDIIGCLDADNQLLGFEFLQRMVDAARKTDVCGAYPSHYAYFPDDTPLNRYFALLGGNDPLCVWLGKADRRSWLVAPGTRTMVFRGSIPSLGSNGHFVKRTCAQPYHHAWRTGHTDGCQVMADNGHGTYTVVDTVLWHRTGVTFWGWLRKRYEYATRLGWADGRRWHLVDTAQDWLAVGGFALAAFLLVPHLWVAYRGYRRVRDWCWVLHVPACLCLTLVYAWAFMTHGYRRLFERR